MRFESAKVAQRAPVRLREQFAFLCVDKMCKIRKGRARGHVQQELFVKGLHGDIKERDLYGLFGSFGRIVSVKIARGRSCASRGRGGVCHICSG